MKFILALIFAAFLVGISVTSAAVTKQKSQKRIDAEAAAENEDSNINETPAENQSIKISPELESQIAIMEDMKIKAAAVNPANLISATLRTAEDQLVVALPTLHELTQLLEGTPLGVFLQNLEIVVTDSSPYLWQSVIESFPEYVRSITEVGGKLATLANTKTDQLTIFHKNKMGLTNLFPVADVSSKAEPLGKGKTKIEEILSDNVGQQAGTSRKAGESEERN